MNDYKNIIYKLSGEVNQFQFKSDSQKPIANIVSNNSILGYILPSLTIFAIIFLIAVILHTIKLPFYYEKTKTVENGITYETNELNYFKLILLTILVSIIVYVSLIKFTTFPIPKFNIGWGF